MNTDNIEKILEEVPNMAATLGIVLIPTEDDESCMAEMKVDEHTRQPFGYLSGGATLALAETLAGAGSYCLCPDCLCLGSNVSGTHIRSVPEGETVTAVAKILHKGNSVHLWQVNVMNSAGEVISNIQVTNHIINKQIQ